MERICSRDLLRATDPTYRSDLTDAEWKRVKPIFGRFRFVKHHPRSLFNAVFYVLKTGCQWRMLQWRMLPQGEAGFSPWQTVYYHFSRWRDSGLRERLCDRIRRA